VFFYHEIWYIYTFTQQSSGNTERDAVEQSAADRLPVFQRKDADRMRVTRCSMNSFVIAGLWSRSGYRDDRVSETKVMH